MEWDFFFFGLTKSDLNLYICVQIFSINNHNQCL